jgi:hypothetical protein
VKRTAVPSILMVLALLGLTAAASAQERIPCSNCEGLNTYGHYIHYGCPSSPGPPVKWNAEAWSDNGEPPPYDSQCPGCTAVLPAVFCWCVDCTISNPFWYAE